MSATARCDGMVVLGACVSPSTAAAFCGPAARPIVEGGCRSLPPCEPGRARDLGTGECVPRREVRAAASAAGIDVPGEGNLVCEEGDELVAAMTGAGALRLACIERKEAFPAPPREPPHANAGVVDLAEWLRASLPGVCARLARSRLGVLTHGETRFALALRVPDNDLTQVSFEARWLVPPRDVDAGTAAAELEAALAPRVEALRGLHRGTRARPSPRPSSSALKPRGKGREVSRNPSQTCRLT